ncbi:MAG: ABC transporter permease [Candidatus Wallbacteria bacterium]|nr:ABC transporter permease [Candidatus Wallbacteria bacterium]
MPGKVKNLFLLLTFVTVLHFIVFSWLMNVVPLLSGISGYDWPTMLLLLLGNLWFVFCGLKYQENQEDFRWSLYLSGYLLLLVFLFLLNRRLLLFLMGVFLYSGMYHNRNRTVYLFIFLFSLIAFSAYWVSGCLLLSFIYAVLSGLWERLSSGFEKVLALSGGLILLLVIFPLLNLLFQYQPQTLINACSPEIWNAMQLSAVTALISTLIILVLGVPLAYIMARNDFRLKAAVDALIDLPIMVPQTAAGIAILVLVGPKTPLGDFLAQQFGMSFAGTAIGIICCQIFVSFPFLVRSAINAFEAVDAKFENASRSLGASAALTFFRITLPLAAPGIFNGCILSFSRALSEAGSLMIVAYRPSTIPIMIDDTFNQFGMREAAPITVVFVGICFWGFISLKWLYENQKRRLKQA